MPLDDMLNLAPPAAFKALQEDTERAGFMLACEPKTGAILRTLAASKPGGRLLEIGTGTGVGTCWVLDGLDAPAQVLMVDINPVTHAIARSHLGMDPRLTILTEDTRATVQRDPTNSLDLGITEGSVGN